MERRPAGSLGPLSEENFLRLAEAGVQSPEFTALCAQLVAELRALCPLEEDVSPTSDFLSSELQAARLLSWKRPPSPQLGAGADAARRELQLINQALGRPEPAPTCPGPQLLEDIKSKVAEALSVLPAGHQEMAPLLRAPLTARQWVLMGSVPDRGGRPNELEPPMPTWEKRREGEGGQQRWGRRGKKKK
ncbi:kinesin-like protein KIFC2 [Platysternon megacephalum]|uniref:Kinesin-like protein KIFC2 n=1 Tax=Platysternon megacephalum TaxID=55544 RepID=A0A4D9DXG8_9SAUR|nr:kinesin-like protein KIFC2 [Platysternon megacephalum]